MQEIQFNIILALRIIMRLIFYLGCFFAIAFVILGIAWYFEVEHAAAKARKAYDEQKEARETIEASDGLIIITDKKEYYVSGIFFYSTAFGDEELMKMRSLNKTLEKLTMPMSRITDEGILSMPEYPELEILEIPETNVTDSCVEKLLSFKKLKVLNISNTRISREAFLRIQKERPDLDVHWAEPFTGQDLNKEPIEHFRVLLPNETAPPEFSN